MQKEVRRTIMDDEKIIEMFFARNELALGETERKYGRYCYAVSYRILNSNEDSEECVNDTWLAAWNAIPPKKPDSLRGFLARICRNISLDRLDFLKADKRNQNVTDAFEELEAFLSGGEENIPEEMFIREAVNRFLASLDRKTRIIFMRRYWYFCSIPEIAESMGISENSVRVTLHRTKLRMKSFFEKDGITI